MWARKHDQCIECGTVEIQHVARGLCVKCYNDFIQKRHSGVKKRGKRFAKELNRELLVKLYWDQSKSLSDIAMTFGITRQAVYLKMLKSITFTQKESELLEKMLSLMDSNAKIIFREERKYGNITSGAVYYFTLNNSKLFDSLVEHGITERKSLVVRFPEVPTPYVRHFIRGCWDGDGSIGKHNLNSHQARFFSGSKIFIEGMLAELEKAGFPSRRIYSRNEGTFFWFSYVGKIVGKLYIYLYEDVPSSMRYERKYLIFRKAFEKHKADQLNLDL
jgi:hypothetical protein